MVAIKRLDSSSNQGAPEFWAEIEMFSKLRHSNLVSLIGYCNDSSEMILVYEFMPLGTLADHIHKFATNLSWVQRLKISIGAARGLHYLHIGTGTKQGIIHRDFKSSNILLDEDYAAKTSDFGLSKIGPTNQSATYVNTLVKGTFGHLHPEYFLSGRLTRKSDVFAFGVVLFELICGRPAVDTSLEEQQCSLAKWAHDCIEEDKLDKIVDSNIKEKIFPKCLKVFAQIANHCLHNRKKHPTMAEVVVALELSLSLQDKFDNCGQPTGIFAFRRKMKGFFFSSPEVNSALRETTPSNKEDSDDNNEVPPFEEIHDLKMFSFVELQRATRNFAREIWLGRGGFGEVFRGWLNKKTYPLIRTAIAVKRIYINVDQQCQYEKFIDLEILKESSHPNLVKILGYCFKNRITYLVYEFVENGSLYSHLFTKDKVELPLKTRVKIAVQVGQALAFLHRTQNEVDNHLLMLHNILLDKDFNAKLSDVEVAKSVYGKFFKEEIIDELYYHPMLCNHFIGKNNRYNFGVVLIEILTGLHSNRNTYSEMISMAERLQKSPRTKLDPRLLNLDHTAILHTQRVATVAFKCIEGYEYISLCDKLALLEQIYADM